MSDELQPQAGGNQQPDEPASSIDDKVASELERARKEAANYRTKLRDLEGKWKEAEPILTEYQKLTDAQKSEAQKATERAAEAERKAADSQAAAERAQRELAVTRLANKAGVDPDLVPYLDLSKLDLEDEKKAMEVLGKLATARQIANGASNPGRSGAQKETDQELREFYFHGGRNKPTIFGG